MKRSCMKIGVSLVFIIAMLLAMTGCDNQVNSDSSPKVRTVEVVKTRFASYPETISYTGYVTSNQVLPHYFSRDGILEALYVSVGDYVQAGDVIAVLEGEDAARDLRAAFNGYVLQRDFQKGDVVSVQMPVIFIAGENQWIQFGITDQDALRIKNYDAGRIKLEVGDTSYHGEWVEISNMPDQTTRTYRALVTPFTEDRLLLGSLVKVNIELETVRGIWLPILYLMNDGQDYVYVMDANERVVRKNVILNEVHGAKVRLEGLEANTFVIVGGAGSVREGQKVRAKEVSGE